MDMERINADAAKYKTKFAVDSAVDEWREQHQAEAQAEYENMGVIDRINETISRNIDTDAIRNAMGETYKNGYDMNPNTPRPFGAVQDIWQDMMDASERTRAAREEYAREWKNMHDKKMNGQVTPEDEENFRNADSDVRRAYADMAASPFRQAARNFIKNNIADSNSFFQGAAQSLQQTDVNLEYFMTSAENLQKKREIEQELGLPAGTIDNNDTFREALEMYNFKQKSDNIEAVWEKYPELKRVTEDMSPEAAAIALHNMPEIRNSRGVIDTFMSFLEKGNTELEYNNLQYKIMMGRATDEEVKRAEDLKGRVEQYNKMEAPGFFQSPLASMAAGVAGSLPEMGQSLAEGVEGGGAAGAALTVGAVALTVISGGTDLLAAGGVAAMRAAIMRALASETGRNLLKTGFYSGMIHGMAAPESGRNYGEMKGMKKPDGTPLYTDEEARNWSLLRGYTNAAIEVANFGMAAKAVYPVANRVFAQAVEQVMREKLGRETLKDFARGRVGDWLKLTASESAEEAAQSVADDVLYNAALSTKGEEGARYKQYSVMDIATRAGQAFIESLPASMGFATVGAGVGTITGAGRIARARKRAADMERDYGQKNTQTMMGVMAVEQLQKAVEQGNLEKVAPDVQKKVLKEQLAGTEFANAYIDVEMAMQKENGREDLQKVAEAAGMSADELEAAITVNGYIPVGTETLAQAKVSPDLLDSVSFSEDADSMARMRENGKTIIEDYKKNFDKMVKRQEKLADAIIENNMKNATAEQKEILRQVMLSNISNPAKEWNDLRKMYNDELQGKIAPALEALKRGMGNAGLMETQDEQGNTKTVRYTENDEWYRNFYKTFKRKPTTAELEDMAIAMVTGDSNAPKVAGWIPDSAEAQAEFEKNRPVIEQLKNNIALLDSVKEEAKKLTGVEMELTQGLTPEAFKVYRAISGWTNKAGGKIARAGRISAILVARHADLYAEAIRKKTGKNYTAEDYIRERLGFQLVQAGIDQDGVLKQLAGVNARTLAAYHNTSVDNLEKLLEQGLAVPSIAITHKDIPYDNFGDVTLVGNRNLIDPERGVPVWTRDAYTTRIPRAEYLPTEKKKIKAFMDKWRENLQGIGEGEYVLDRLEEAAQEDPERVEARTHRDEFTYYYLTKVLGRDVELKHIRPDYEVPILRNGIYAEQIESIMHSKKKKADKKKALTEVFVARYEKALAEYAESIPKKKAYLDAQPSPKRKMMYEKALERQHETQDNLAAIKQTGEISEEQYKEIQKDISRVDKAEKESTEIDWSKTFSEMRANNKDALNSDKYQQWQDKLLDDIRGDAVIKIGRKYEPYTTDNIVRAMLTEKGAGQEGGLGFSTSKAAAIGATPLKSIADLHKNESRLVTREQANGVIADVDAAIYESFEGVREYHKNIAADSYSLPEIYNEAVANAIKGGKKATATNVKAALKKMEFDVAKIPASAIDDVVNAANQMRDAAAWYFEAKPQRAVGINEFSGAVVPIDTPAETIRKLEDNGLTVETYNPEVAGDRQRATKAVQDARVETLFQRAWHGTPHDFEKFDLGAIGTGEGLQVHGWGLYFAQDRSISEERYKKRLSKGRKKEKLYKINGKEVIIDEDENYNNYDNQTFADNPKANAEKYAAWLIDRGKTQKEILRKIEDEKQQTNDYYEDNGEEWSERELKFLNELEKIIKERKIEFVKLKEKRGKLFEVEIPDNDVLLDEQKTLGEQPNINRLLEEYAEKTQDWSFTAGEINGEETTGKELYDWMVTILGSPKAASEELNKMGIKGITYKGARDGRCFVIFDDKAIDIIEKYNQQVNGSQDGQGWIDINPGADGRRIVHILETADESTFMHEMAHAFLFDLEDLARIDDTSAKELEIVNQWAEWKKGDYKEYKRTAWADEFAQREQAIIDAEENHDYERAEKLKAEWRQERFARGFEMYLKEGNAPAPGLKAVFRLFKQFLSAIYKAFTGDGGKPSVQVRRVMDRMIASEDEIEAAALQDRYSDIVKAGGEKLFNEREGDTMKRWAKEEREAAKEKVLKLVMRDLEKEKQLEYNNRMAEERERYQKELAQENIFLARNLIAETKNKKDATMWFDSVEEFEALDKVTPDMETLVNQHMQEYGQQLDKSLIDSHLSQEAIDKAMDSSKYRVKLEKYILKGMERKKNLVNSINAKARAAMTSIEEKLNALPEDVDLQLEKNDNPTIKDIVKEITKLRFAGKWNTQDINHIEAMLRASTQAEARKALKEFKDRQKQQKQNMQDIEEATKGMESFYRDLIKQTTADRPMSETCNIKYYKDKERNTERRVQQMAKAQNWEMAIHQQRQKVFYSMMVRQARENRDTRDKMIKDLQRKLNARTVKIPKDERYWFNRILYIMRLNPTNPKMPEGGVTSLDNIFKEQQEALENIYVPDQLIQIRDAGENFGDFNKMTLSDFSEAYEDLVRLYELGRTKFNFKSIAGKSFEDVAREIIEDPDKLPGLMALTRKVGPNQGGIGYIDALGNLGQTGHDVAKYIQQYHNSILKTENILEMLGPKAQKYIYGLLEKAAEKEAILAEKNLRAIQDINAMFTREEHQEWTEQKYDFPGTKGWKITKENILMMAINYGSEKNRQRLIGGLIEDGRKKDKMSAQQVQEAIEDLFKETMTAKDWEFVQRLWDHIGSYWHETAAVEEKLNGIALGKVEPLPFSIQTADGKVVNLKGGYMHIKYDFEKSARAEENEINDMAMSISAGAKRLGVGRGMVKARTEHNVYMEVVLNFDVINQHLHDVIHNIAYRIPVRDIYRLLHYKNDSAGLTMETYIKESLGAEAFRVLDAWAMDSWRQVSDNRNSAESSLNKFFRGVRSNATMAIMGFRIKPVLENLGNLPIAMNQIGSMKMLNALFGFYRDREENYQEVIARSAFMRTRAENLDRDLKNQPGVFHQGNKLLEVAKEHAYDMLVVTDLMVSAPMWWQVYHESIKPKMKEVQKENEENMQKRLDLSAKADSIRAEIAEHFKGAADIDEHLKVRRYGTPADIEALRGTEFAGISEGELRAQWGQHQNEIRNLNKELFKVEQELEKENQLPVYSNDEILEEAKQRAVFAADKVVRDTIGSGRVIDQSAVQRSTNELVRLFTAFYSFFNAQWNLIYMAYAKSKYAPEGTGSIEKWAPLAKTLMFNVFLSALMTTAVGFAFGLKGDSDDEKFETVTKDGKKEKVEKPWLERFLRAYAKESLSVSTGGLYGIRDIIQLVGDYAFSGQNFGYKMGSVATRGFSEVLRAGDMLIRKGEKDAEIQAQQDKRQKAHEEKLAKLKGKKRREYLQKWEEEQKYRKPPKRITYEEILSHGVSGLTTLTAAKTGLTTTLTDAITHTMMYMMDKDMRYDPSWKNIVWSAIFDKKPVEREIPKKPPTEPKKKKKKKQSER